MNRGQKMVNQIVKDTTKSGHISNLRKCRIAVRASLRKDDLRTLQHYKNLNK